MGRPREPRTVAPGSLLAKGQLFAAAWTETKPLLPPDEFEDFCSVLYADFAVFFRPTSWNLYKRSDFFTDAMKQRVIALGNQIAYGGVA